MNFARYLMLLVLCSLASPWAQVRGGCITCLMESATSCASLSKFGFPSFTTTSPPKYYLKSGSSLLSVAEI